MAYDGNGVFNRLYNWEADAAAGINILAERMDAEHDGFATGLSICLTRDGQAGMLANLDMGGFRITGVGDATAVNDAVSRAFGDARYLRLDGSGVMTGPMNGISVQWIAGGNTRWNIPRDPASGNLVFNRFSAAGAYQSTPIILRESDGAVVVQGALDVTGQVTLRNSQDILISSAQAWRYARTNNNSNVGVGLQDSLGSDRLRLFVEPTRNIGWLQLLDWGGNGNIVFQSLQVDGNGLRLSAGNYRGLLTNEGASLQMRTGNVCSFDWASPNARIFVDSTAIVIGTASDRRVKTVLGKITDALETIAKLNPIRYNPKVALGFENLLADETAEQQGLIADEVQKLVPSIVSGEPNDPKQLQSVYYAGLVPLLIAAVQELTSRLAKLEQGV